MEGHKLNREDSLGFILAGNATVTMVNSQTGNRFTFKVKKAENSNTYFVSLLIGSDNESDYQYMGCIFKQNKFTLTKNSKYTADTQSYKVFQYIFSRLVSNAEIPAQVEIWHEGFCGRCGRKLTVPESIESGIGPDCSKRLGDLAAFTAGLNFEG